MWIQRWKAGKGIRYLVEGEAEYIGLQKEKEAWLRILGMLAGLFLCYVAIRNHQYYIIILGVAVFLASLMFKDMAVTEEGVEIRYLMPGWHMENAWSWEEITHVLVDYKQAAPNPCRCQSRQGTGSPDEPQYSGGRHDGLNLHQSANNLAK